MRNNREFSNHQIVTLTDGRVAQITDIPELDHDLLVIQDQGELEVINTFQVAA